jgi:large subunit ribosomal protein L24
MMRIRRGDLVKVIAGADSGKQGRVISIDRKASRVRIEKVRMQKRHLKPGRKGARAGGVIEQEGYIHISNVMLLNPEGEASRVRIEPDGEKRTRVFSRGGHQVPDPVEA